MIKARKGNREYSIDKQEQKNYQGRGFDIVKIDDDGNETVIAYNPSKKVSYSDYEALLAENEQLKEQLDGNAGGNENDKQLSYDEMKVIGKKLGLEFAGNISGAKLFEMIKATGKEQEA